MTENPPISPELREMVIDSWVMVLLKDTYLNIFTQAKKMQSPSDQVNMLAQKAWPWKLIYMVSRENIKTEAKKTV